MKWRKIHEDTVETQRKNRTHQLCACEEKKTKPAITSVWKFRENKNLKWQQLYPLERHIEKTTNKAILRCRFSFAVVERIRTTTQVSGRVVFCDWDPSCRQLSACSLPDEERVPQMGGKSSLSSSVLLLRNAACEYARSPVRSMERHDDEEDCDGAWRCHRFFPRAKFMNYGSSSRDHAYLSPLSVVKSWNPL